MFTNRCRVLLAGLLTLLFTVPAVAQQQAPALPTPQLTVVTPAGGKAGTVVEVGLTGLALDDPTDLRFSNPVIKAELVSASQATDPKKPAPAGPIKYKVTIPADAPLGFYDVRVVTKAGLSNPRTFVVSDLVEELEKESNNDVPDAQKVALNTTINGAIGAVADVDFYQFPGKKGQRVVVSCLTTSIDSRLPAAIELYNKTSGNLLASNRDYQGNDAVLDATLPEDGDYYVRVYAFTYTQGSPEHFYRLTISTAPWIDAVFPPMVEPGKATKVTLYGRNLPGGKPDPSARHGDSTLETATVTVTAPKDAAALSRLAFSGFISPRSSGLDGFEHRVKNDAGTSNPAMLNFATAPVVLDNEANDTVETAQEVKLPCEIAGRIEKKRDRDWYGFTAKKGDTYSIELYGERLGGPMDLYFQLRNGTTKQAMTEVDDNPDVLSPTMFLTRTEDPARYQFTAPADGPYQIMVSSREAYTQAGPRHVYRLRITPEQPDFRLIVMPASPVVPEGAVLRQGGAQYFNVFAWRQDGFNGEIKLEAQGLPQGVKCVPQTLLQGQRQGVLVLTAAADAPVSTTEFRLVGTAKIDEKDVVREARPASLTWGSPQQQPNVTLVSRLDRDLLLAVRDKGGFKLNVTPEKPTAAAGDKLVLTIKGERLSTDLKAPILVTAIALPPNATTIPQANQPIQLAPGKDEGTLTVNIPNTIQPGTYTVVLRGVTQLQGKNPMGKNQQNFSITLPSEPILVTVTPKGTASSTAASAMVTVNPASPTIASGKQIEVTVKVKRTGGYDGEFKVELVPMGTGSVLAAMATIPSGKDETKLVVKIKDGASAGTRDGVFIRVTATGGGKAPAPTEVKFPVTIAD